MNSKVKNAQLELLKLLKRFSWLRGIGIYSDTCIKVNVKEITEDILKQIPNKVNGVKVKVQAVGDLITL